MNETILIARNRKTGKDVLLAGREIPYPQQRDQYYEFTGGVHKDYDRVAIVRLDPVKKPLKLITVADAKLRDKKNTAGESNKEAGVESTDANSEQNSDTKTDQS
jgi:hypothetical protein